ncbi:hypothetical protein [Aeromonas dhakensis]|uniref:hypothetical protein n=1 Tax=Aeromonas dhakensis TaxID=196024 RepID=UPI001177B477|nr:hypothetical protein [Aeromonas dhakensis]
MAQDSNIETNEFENELQKLTSLDMRAFLKEKMPTGVLCPICHSRDVNIIGTNEQLFTFKIPAAYTDTKDDDRVIFTALLECGNCGHLLFVSPNALLQSKGIKLS